MLSQREEPTIWQALAEMLQQNRVIQSIDLSNNDITTVGAQAPFEPSELCRFRWLSNSSEPQALAAALRVNKVVTEMKLDDNDDISEEATINRAAAPRFFFFSKCVAYWLQNINILPSLHNQLYPFTPLKCVVQHAMVTK